MRLPTSFVGRLIGPHQMQHLDSKLHIMVHFRVMEEFLVWTSIVRNQLNRLDCHVLFPVILDRGMIT